MKILKARFIRFLHTFICWNRTVDGWWNGETKYLGCECGRHFYVAPGPWPLGGESWDMIYGQKRSKS